ncbi:homoserine dehydrogenase [Virgibacillus sp. W0181]|uniref:homoserine dehydrogenase n=1 Tax=Virgibacillus sp. W0181 TaxID=3391581 RepID=UPI003F4752D0
MTKKMKLGLIGFGNVGQGLASILKDKKQLLEDSGIAPIIVAISDPIKGSIYNPEGLDIASLLETVQAGKSLEDLEATHKGWSAIETIQNADIDVMVELAYTDLKTGEPAFTHMKEALKKGVHVVTTNKGPIALHYKKLMEVSNQTGAQLRVEGTVMSGTPTLITAMESLKASNITKIEGILNGTTNYILTRMNEGFAYDEALKEAQDFGYAEADPAGDVEGHDAAGKVVILANLVLNQNLELKDVVMKGITNIEIKDMEEARKNNQTIKLLGRLEESSDGWKGEVKPVKIDKEHPLASVNGATNAITFTTEILGDITVIGPGAGRLETGYSVIEDLIAIQKKVKQLG